MATFNVGPCPPRFVELKKEIAASYPDFEARVTKAWGEILEALDSRTKDIAQKGSQNVPEVNFSELGSVSEERVKDIKEKGCVVIRDVVDDEEAKEWHAWLREYVTKNPDVDGTPEHDKQFFQLYWTKSQIRARAHPNVLETSKWLNQMYHVRGDDNVDEVDLSTPLTYADRFRMRHPGVGWNSFPPHIDGGSIERWEDQVFRGCFAEILSGDWRAHDPYDLRNRVNARSSLYKRPNQATVFRTYQGWLALSETGPNEGTLQVFPSVHLSNAYILLRPFFSPRDEKSAESFDPADWKFDISDPDFPGIYALGQAFIGPRPSTKKHPHLRLDETMVPVPKVYPGDMVFWHCDVVHAVEQEHVGKADSTVMYIPAVPYTPTNAAYVQKQRESFLQGVAPPDFPATKGEAHCAGVGKAEDIDNPAGKRAMGFTIEVA
ncbi:DUF1479-domain-containing protein [Lenzites betulinus]|nr:DUF1479-domain-containing protein [Lenzites betulinus]